jgi:hypothetical protein
MAADDNHRKNFIDTLINLYIDGNIFKDIGSDGAGKGIFNGISIDWEFPAVPSMFNFYSKNDGTYMKNLFMDLKN